MGKPQVQPKTPRRRLCFHCTRSRANNSPALAVLARFAAVLEREEHGFPMADWARLLLVLAPEDYAEPPMAAVATTHLPGSAGNLAVMMGQIARGFSPFHPGDGMTAWRELVVIHVVRFTGKR